MNNRIKTKSQRDLERAQTYQHEINSLYARVFSSSEGKTVLNDIIHKLCRVEDDIGGSDALNTYRLLGRRSVGLEILKKLKVQE